MSTLEASIDELYTQPLADFTASRNALARMLKGEDAARVRRLQKPSVIAWTVNQLYWRERRTYERLTTAGRALRAAQIAALQGGTADARAAVADHRSALAAAVATATQLAAQAGYRPATEPLTRMLEALSLLQEQPSSPGRFTELLQPAGFEALTGVTPLARPRSLVAPARGRRPGRDARARDTDTAERRRTMQAAAAARKAAEARVLEARHLLDRAHASEARAQAHTDAVRQQLVRAQSALDDAHTDVERARRELSHAEAALKAL